MYHRCEARVQRNNKRVLNGFRMETLQQMVRTCYSGLSEPDRFHMVESIVAMAELSEDESSPRHHMCEEDARTEIFQAYEAYQVGLDLVRRMREAEERAEQQPEDPQSTMVDDSSSGSENLPEQMRRYLHCSLEEASDPELWMEIHRGGSDLEIKVETDGERNEDG